MLILRTEWSLFPSAADTSIPWTKPVSSVITTSRQAGSSDPLNPADVRWNHNLPLLAVTGSPNLQAVQIWGNDQMYIGQQHIPLLA